jgi:hypothetical protein
MGVHVLDSQFLSEFHVLAEMALRAALTGVVCPGSRLSGPIAIRVPAGASNASDQRNQNQQRT